MGLWGTGMHGHTSYVLAPFWESQLEVVDKPHQSGSHIIYCIMIYEEYKLWKLLTAKYPCFLTCNMGHLKVL